MEKSVDTNWLRFYQRLGENLKSIGNGQVALFVVDIDLFHIYCLKFGFDGVESLMAQVVDRLEKGLNRVSIIERISPQQVGIVVSGEIVPELLELAAQKILNILSSPVTVEGDNVQVEATVGVALFPDHGDQIEKLTSGAFSSLAEAKNLNQGYHIHALSETLGHFESWQMEKDLKSAIEEDQLLLNYQPKINILTGKTCSSEVLMRWKDNKNQYVSPSHFIPVAESSGFIGDLTEWGLATALRQMSQFSRKYPAITTAINLSASSIYDSSIIRTVESALDIWDVEAERLVLEVTEGTLMKNQALCFKNLKILREMGVSISIDDFGTGYSSLAYFKSIPANEIKIDQSFIRSIADNQDDAKIVESIIDLSHKFDFRVVAEGIESEAALNILADMGCDVAQGYFISKPLEFEDFRLWLEQEMLPG